MMNAMSLISLLLLTAISSSFRCKGHTSMRSSSLCMMGGIKSSFGSGGGDMRIKIQGTTNAYTTLRPYDVVLYGLEDRVDDKTRALGYYKADTKEVVPLCNRIEGCTEFFQDVTQSPLSAEKLKNDGLLLRVVSSDRRISDGCYIIEEYLDSDIFIPLSGSSDISDNSQKLNFEPQLSTSSISGQQKPISSQDASFSELQAKLNAAQKQLQDVQALLLDALRLREQTPGNDQTTSIHEQVLSSSAPAPVGPYSQAVRANGFIFLSGSLGLDPQSGKLVGGGIVFQTDQALNNIGSVLKSSKSDFSKVVKTTILLKDIKDSGVVNNLYKERFAACAFSPARTTYQVGDLPMGALIEIEVVAVE